MAFKYVRHFEPEWCEFVTKRAIGRPPPEPKGVPCTRPVFVAIHPMATWRAGLSGVVRATPHNLGGREVFDVGHAFGGIWHILARSAHRLLSLAAGLGPVVESQHPTLFPSTSESLLQSPDARKRAPPPSPAPPYCRAQVSPGVPLHLLHDKHVWIKAAITAYSSKRLCERAASMPTSGVPHPVVA